MIEHYKFQSVLDVGAGTGRTITYLKKKFPPLKIVGVEPVKELREIGYQKGVSKDELIDGDGNKLGFTDNTFDLVCEFAVLHHVPKPAIMVQDMIRVSKKAIFISDVNGFGQGNFLVRSVKQLINGVKLWKAFNWITTKGKVYKLSEGDGLFYFYSVFNNYNLVDSQYKNVHVLNTRHTMGINPYRHAPQIALFGYHKK